VTVANNAILRSTSHGTCQIDADHGVIDIAPVSHVPGLSRNLISIGQATSDGLEFRFKKDSCQILDDHGRLISEIMKDTNNLYQLPSKVSTSTEKHSTTANMSSVDTHRLWHNRLGHINDRDLKASLQNTINCNWSTRASQDGSPCHGCMLGKMPRGDISRSSSSSTTRPLEIIHSDIAGPFPTEGLHGRARYYISFLDQHTRYSSVYFLQKKSDALSAIKRFINMANNLFSDQGFSVKILQTDNGGEYTSEACQTFLTALGIVHRTIIPYQSEQNGMIERLNRTILD